MSKRNFVNQLESFENDMEASMMPSRKQREQYKIDVVACSSTEEPRLSRRICT